MEFALFEKLLGRPVARFLEHSPDQPLQEKLDVDQDLEHLARKSVQFEFTKRPHNNSLKGANPQSNESMGDFPMISWTN